MPEIIAFSGFKQSGKDTSCKLLGEILNQANDGVVPVRVERRAFADKLKVSAARALGFDRDDNELIALMDSFKGGARFTIEYAEPADNGGGNFLHELSGREYLQWYGTEAHREVFADSFWVDQVIPTPSYIEHCLEGRYYKEGVKQVVSMSKFDGADVCVVTDCRFPNEAERVLDVFGEVWEVVRPGLEGGDTHASEKPLPDSLVTRRIINDGTIDDLRSKIAAAWDDAFSVREDR